jgi:endonuclease/exonuclease/phosphatase family metal-dependent hydrolase
MVNNVIKVKKTKKNNTKKTTRNSLLKVLSYNISWESMAGSVKDWPLCSNNNDSTHPHHNSVCVSNIANVINNNKVDFISLQEAFKFKSLIKESDVLQNMDYKIHESNKDVCVTFWTDNYIPIKTMKNEFEPGRPWLAILFKCKKLNYKICFINVHFGHYSNIVEYKMLNTMFTNVKNTMEKYNEKYNTKLNDSINASNSSNSSNIRYIIAGDFNYDIKNISNSNGIISFDNIRFYHHPKHILTCCINRKKHYDHVIDTHSTPLDIIIPEVEYMASDHKPIMVTLSK